MRFVTAASLFDGHDVSINLFRRLLVRHGQEVIHLGHNRSVQEIVRSAIQEDAHAIAISSYQGGHTEYFTYLLECLAQEGAGHIAVFGGGGGVITPPEIEHLESIGVDKLFSPSQGQKLGLDEIINEMIRLAQKRNQEGRPKTQNSPSNDLAFAQKLTGLLESNEGFKEGRVEKPETPIIGITGTGGAGKSSLIDEFILRYRLDFPEHRILVLSCDPSKQKTHGALLGDRIRMNAIYEGHVFMRSIAVSEETHGIHPGIFSVLNELSQSDDLPNIILIESAGIGQVDSKITKFVDKSIYVMTSEFGAESQLEKIAMLDFADLIVVNKMDRQGAQDALHQVRKTVRRSRTLDEPSLDHMVVGACASRFQDALTHRAYGSFLTLINDVQTQTNKPAISSRFFQNPEQGLLTDTERALLPRHRAHYLSEIAEGVRSYHRNYQKVSEQLKDIDAMERVKRAQSSIELDIEAKKKAVPQKVWDILDAYEAHTKDLNTPELTFQVRGKDFTHKTTTESLSGLNIPKVSSYDASGLSDAYTFCAKENYPGSFPYTAGIYPFKRTDELPKRMFAGEGGPHRTNERFHYLCKGEQAKRLSTAFDSVTLYGADPDERPDIFGKIGEAGVSIATLDDMKTLFEGFDLCDPLTSVSMTINGPAPIILAFFFNAALDQQVDRFTSQENREPNEQEFDAIRTKVLSSVRGTVQADILKEDQAQNTCIFSTPFALRMMGDVQAYFIDKNVRNFYSVSISGYHIAEAGATPITQLAFTLANGFTYVELYKARGMDVSAFSPSLSYFFSNGLDPEYTVLGRVARRIWAIAMRDIYETNHRSQKLKYHIQTSGRSLHAQEIDFNDIRTTLQALTAIADNCNSLHTNAYDEAITTPTPESVRRAMAVQLITSMEMGLTKNETPLQGSHYIEWLTDHVEEAVLQEFDRISDRGGVLQAMEFQYQRNKIQSESYIYEHMKHDGTLPIVGVNTFVADSDSSEEPVVVPLSRSSDEEKQDQIKRLRGFKERNQDYAEAAKDRLKTAALDSTANLFETLMSVSRVLSLGQISDVLYECGGQYRRNM